MSTDNIEKKLRAQISKTKSVHIQGIDNSSEILTPVYAINWFNTKRLWLYNIYNLLAGLSVKKVSGQGFFKGKTGQHLLGDENLRRDVLLIVKYPAAKSFIQLVEIKFFQLVSLLRVLAVKDFTFGFSQRTDAATVSQNQWTKQSSSSYAVMHYTAAVDIAAEVGQFVAEFDLQIYYSGSISAYLYSGDGEQASAQIPCIMDGIIVFEGKDVQSIKNAINAVEFHKIIEKTKEKYIAILDRVF
jgi:hypothetical protein